MSSEIGSTIALPEPELVFSAERESYRDIHPLRGLARYGPYSNSFFVSNPIQIATIAPFGESRRLNEFLRDLDQSFRPTERTDYLPDWPGFSKVFGTRKADNRCARRSEEHTSELQSLMRTSYAVFRLKKKKIHNTNPKLSTSATKITCCTQ